MGQGVQGLAGLAHIADVHQVDGVAVGEVVVRQALEELVVLVPGPEGGGGLLIGYEVDVPDVGDPAQGRFHLPGLLLAQAQLHEGQHLVLLLQVRQHGVGVHRDQGEGAHDQQAGYRDAHGREGHEAVAEHVHSAFFDKIEKIVLVHSVFLP